MATSHPVNLRSDDFQKRKHETGFPEFGKSESLGNCKRHTGDAADPDRAAVLTEEEHGWLQAFLKWLVWHDLKSDVNQMIGNAVLVNTVRDVAEMLKHHPTGSDNLKSLTSVTFEKDAHRGDDGTCKGLVPCYCVRREKASAVE